MSKGYRQNLKARPPVKPGLHPVSDLTKRVRVENMDPSDRALLNHIVLARQKERRAAEDTSNAHGR